MRTFSAGLIAGNANLFARQATLVRDLIRLNRTVAQLIQQNADSDMFEDAARILRFSVSMSSISPNLNVKMEYIIQVDD